MKPSSRTISSSPSKVKTVTRPHYTLSKSPDKLRTVTGTVARPRPSPTIVNKSKPICANTTTNNSKARTSNIVKSASPSVATRRVSDLDALMAEKHINNNNNNNHTKTSPDIDMKPSAVFTPLPPPPIVNNIRRSLFSKDSVKIVRPVRSQELKTFSSQLSTDISLSSSSPPPQTTVAPTASDEISEITIDETLSTLTPISFEQQTDSNSHDNEIIVKHDDSSSNASVLTHELSEDSLNEHYHIRKLLNDSKCCSFFSCSQNKAH